MTATITIAGKQTHSEVLVALDIDRDQLLPVLGVELEGTGS